MSGKIKQYIDELEKEWIKFRDLSNKDRTHILWFVRFREAEAKLKTAKEVLKLVGEVVDEMDVELYRGEYCFRANSFKEQVKKEIGLER